jgi:hypothetical protein
MMTRLLLLLLPLVCLVPPALAADDAVHGFFDGNDLLRWCTSKDALCTGYVAGVSDELSRNGPTVCRPEHVTVEQLRELVTRYLERHPEERQLQASSLVVGAMRDAWPCRGGR